MNTNAELNRSSLKNQSGNNDIADAFYINKDPHLQKSNDENNGTSKKFHLELLPKFENSRETKWGSSKKLGGINQLKSTNLLISTTLKDYSILYE